MKKFKFKINESEYEVSVNEMDENVAEIEVNGTPFTVEIERQVKPTLAAVRKPAGKVTPITTPTRLVSAGSVKSPLPGVIVKVLVQVGQSVKRGDVMLTMESMKMENNILAEEDSIIKTVHVQPGQSVMQDDVLIDFEGTLRTETVTVPNVVNPVAAPVAAVKTAGTVTVKSPLPGSVIKVYVAVGETIKRGDTLLTLESMKMENSILAEKNAVVKAIHVVAGQTVMQDEALLDLE